MESRPTPSGFQHSAVVRLGCAPDARFTDPVRVLADLEAGMTQPIVEVVGEHADGGVLVQVSVFGDSAEPSRDAVAVVHGLVAELTYAVGGSASIEGRIGFSGV